MSLPEPRDLDAWLAAREAAVAGVRPGCEKRMVWPDGTRARAPLAMVYVHGFSATGRELSPLAEDVAEALGAPLFVTRLAGHGQDGAALGRARHAAWRADVAEALAIGAALGERVVVMACSTGATLTVEALGGGARIAGLVLVSPNFGLRARAAQWMLDAPGSRVWGPLVGAGQIGLPARSAAHAKYWTTHYPARAVIAADDAVRAARGVDHAAIDVPAMFAFCEADRVVDPARTREVMARWGGPVAYREMVMGPGDDPNGHLVAGEVHSPGQTAALARDTLAWIRGLP